MPTQVEIPGTGAKVPVWVILGGAGAALLLGFLKGSPTQEADQADQQSSSGMILSEIQRLLGQQREEYLTLFDQTLNQSDGPVEPPDTPGTGHEGYLGPPVSVVEEPPGVISPPGQDGVPSFGYAGPDEYLGNITYVRDPNSPYYGYSVPSAWQTLLEPLISPPEQPPGTTNPPPGEPPPPTLDMGLAPFPPGLGGDG